MTQDSLPEEELPEANPEWRQYEDQIVDRLGAQAGDDAEVLPDERLEGRFSLISRQIDIVVRGSFAGLPDMLVVVDCKCWSRPVTVSDVDRLIGLVDDVEAHLGILVTNRGASKAALRRGGRSVQVQVVPFDDLASWAERMPTVAHTAGTETATLTYWDGTTWQTELVTAEFAEAVLRRRRIQATRHARQRERSESARPATGSKRRNRRRPRYH